MEKIKAIIENIKSRLDFKFHPITTFPLLMVVLAYPAVKYLPIKYTYENSLIENFQLVVLSIAFVISILAAKKNKLDKVFYYTLALVCTILFLREISYGRAWFFPVEGVENAFLSWKDIKYGFLAEPLVGVYIALCGLYFIVKKGYLSLFKFIKKAKISVYNWIFLFVGVYFGLAGEEVGNFALEEMFETCFYLAFLAIIYLNAFNKDYKIEE